MKLDKQRKSTNVEDRRGWNGTNWGPYLRDEARRDRRLTELVKRSYRKKGMKAE